MSIVAHQFAICHVGMMVSIGRTESRPRIRLQGGYPVVRLMVILSPYTTAGNCLSQVSRGSRYPARTLHRVLETGWWPHSMTLLALGLYEVTFIVFTEN